MRIRPAPRYREHPFLAKYFNDNPTPLRITTLSFKVTLRALPGSEPWLVCRRQPDHDRFPAVFGNAQPPTNCHLWIIVCMSSRGSAARVEPSPTPSQWSRETDCQDVESALIGSLHIKHAARNDDSGARHMAIVLISSDYKATQALPGTTPGKRYHIRPVEVLRSNDDSSML